ncbi:MAG: hypothetical protein JSS56_26755, partial [Proteobacteria bacterium]|nr:hypothetical protein [Pseudomonadota bacterium]
PGWELRRVVIADGPRAAEAVPAVLGWLSAQGHAHSALCGMEFRQFTAGQMTRAEFAAFNDAYVAQLRAAGLLVDGKVPLTRTNVVMKHSGTGDALHAFTYVAPSSAPQPVPNFVLSAIPEVRFRTEQGRLHEEVVEAGGDTPQAVRAKLDFIAQACGARLRQLGLDWRQVSQMQLYCEADLPRSLQWELLCGIEPAGRRGLQCFHALPPIGPAAMEMDARHVASEHHLERL